jgi:hypothetical protein
MKTVLGILERAYNEIKESNDSSLLRRDLYLIIEHLKGSNESGVKLGYFYNEKGDYTLTLNDEPAGVCFTETDCLKIVNHVNSLTMRVDVLSKIKPFQLT